MNFDTIMTLFTTIALWCGTPSPTNSAAQIQACRDRILVCFDQNISEAKAKQNGAYIACFNQEKLK
jgi:hypothetical protein